MKIFIDIGAWIGPYTLIAASMGMKVYAFEPDKVAFQELKKNIELNSFKHKPEIFNFGLSKIASKAYLYSNTNDFGKTESGLINYKNHQNTKKTEIELKELSKLLNREKDWKIEVVGYADNIGSAGYNKKLSEKRAKAIASFLSKYGVTIETVIKTEGLGSISSSPNNDTSSQSRRVDVVLRK